MSEDVFRNWLLMAERPTIGITVTLAVYAFALRLHRRCGRNPALHPTLTSIIALATILELSGVPYDTYSKGAGLISELAGPAVVMLAVPLYRQASLIRASAPLVIIALAVALPVGIASGVGVAWLLGADPQTLLSLAPKSVTTGIAIPASQALGGTPALTAVFVISTGIVGGVFGPRVTRLTGVTDERAIGLAMGIGSHGIGTARAFQIGETAGAFSSLGMSLNCVVIGLLLPLAVALVHH